MMKMMKMMINDDDDGQMMMMIKDDELGTSDVRGRAICWTRGFRGTSERA